MPDPIKPDDPNAAAALEAADKGIGGAIAQEPTKPELPSWLPEKFAVVSDDGKVDIEASAAKLGGSYIELEKKQSGGDASKQEPTDAGSDKLSLSIKPADASADDAAKALGDRGIDMSALQAHYAEHGGLSDEHYATLDKAGIPRAMVDDYIAGQEARANAFRQSVFDFVGGEEAYSALAEWAGANLDEPSLNAYNEAMDSGDPAKAQMAVTALHTAHQNATGAAPRVQVEGDGSGPTAPSFADESEMIAAMRDPRYKKSPAYRAEVAAKIDASQFMNQGQVVVGNGVGTSFTAQTPT